MKKFRDVHARVTDGHDGDDLGVAKVGGVERGPQDGLETLRTDPRRVDQLFQNESEIELGKAYGNVRLFFKKWANPCLFFVFLIFSNKQYKNVMSIQYMVPGFKPTISQIWVTTRPGLPPQMSGSLRREEKLVSAYITIPRDHCIEIERCSSMRAVTYMHWMKSN